MFQSLNYNTNNRCFISCVPRNQYVYLVQLLCTFQLVTLGTPEGDF